MASSTAIDFMNSVYRRTDKQIRDLLAEQPAQVAGVTATEVDTINALVGDGVSVLAPGRAAAIRVDFQSRITGCFVQEFDEIVGSVILDIGKGQSRSTFAPVSIVGDSPPVIENGRYYEDTDVSDWSTTIDRGDVLVFSIAEASLFTRLLVALRIERLEP